MSSSSRSKSSRISRPTVASAPQSGTATAQSGGASEPYAPAVAPAVRVPTRVTEPVGGGASPMAPTTPATALGTERLEALQSLAPAQDLRATAGVARIGADVSLEEYATRPVPIADISVDPDQARKTALLDEGGRRIREEQIEEMVRSIAANGLLQPITLYANGDGGFTILYGETRFLACERLKHRMIPARVVPRDIAAKQREVQLVENQMRFGMTPMSLALSLDELRRAWGAEDGRAPYSWTDLRTVPAAAARVRRLQIGSNRVQTLGRLIGLPADIQHRLVGRHLPSDSRISDQLRGLRADHPADLPAIYERIDLMIKMADRQIMPQTPADDEVADSATGREASAGVPSEAADVPVDGLSKAQEARRRGERRVPLIGTESVRTASALGRPAFELRLDAILGKDASKSPQVMARVVAAAIARLETLRAQYEERAASADRPATSGSRSR